MSDDALAGDPRPVALHATAIAIGARALLIRGPSKSGKSSLALDLLGQSGAFAAPVKLIGDDRVVLSVREGLIFVSPHPLIAGLIEKRGHGWFAMPYVAGVSLGSIVSLARDLDDSAHDLGRLGASGRNGHGGEVPSLFMPCDLPFMARSRAVIDWYTATLAAHPGQKPRAWDLKSGKD